MARYLPGYSSFFIFTKGRMALFNIGNFVRVPEHLRNGFEITLPLILLGCIPSRHEAGT